MLQGQADTMPLENDGRQKESMKEGNVLDLEARQLESLSSTGGAEQDALISPGVQSLHHEEGSSDDNHNNEEIKSCKYYWLMVHKSSSKNDVCLALALMFNDRLSMPGIY